MSLARTATAARSLTAASAFLPESAARRVVVPTDEPVDAPAVPASASQLQDEHASTSSTLFPDGARGFVLARTVENGRVLELRWINITTCANKSSQDQFDGVRAGSFSSLDDGHVPLAPVQLEFPANLVPSPAMFMIMRDDGTPELQIYAVTEAGLLYAMRFSGATLFHSTTFQDENDWCEELRVHSLVGQRPVLIHGVDEARLVVANADGSAVSIVITEGSGGLIETELRPASSFSVRSLIPSFSTRNLTSPGRGSPATSSTQLVSLATLAGETVRSAFAFGVSRDRRLRIWNLDTGVCLKSIDLPKPASSSLALVPVSDASVDADVNASPSTRRGLGSLLPPTPQPFVKVVAGSDSSPHSTYLIIMVPATSSAAAACFAYGIATDEGTGALNELTPVCDRLCPSSAATLVDFDVQRLSVGTDETEWTLWTAWEEGGECALRCVGLPELEGVVVAEDEMEWVTVDKGFGLQTAQWTPAYFDDLLDGSPLSIPDVFFEHISFPGRYPVSALDTALQHYEDALEEELQANGAARPTALSTYFETALDRIRAIVASAVQLEQSIQTGAYMREAYDYRVKMEWLKFVAMLNQSRAQALFPTALGIDAQRGVVLVALREGIVVPVVQETALALRDLAALDDDAPRKQRFLNAPPNMIQSTYPALAERGLRTDILHMFKAIDCIERSLSTSQRRTLEDGVISRVRAPFAFSVEDVAIDLYAELLEPLLEDETVTKIDDILRELVTPEASFQACWALLTTSEVIAPIALGPSDSVLPSDLGSAILCDAITASAEARFQLARRFTTLLLVVCGEETDLVPELASLLSATFATLHSLASLRWVVSQPQSPSLEEVKDEDVLSRFSGMKVTSEPEATLSSSFSLLHGLLRSRYAPTLPSDVPLPDAMTQGISAFFSNVGLVSQKRLVVDSPPDVTFALRLRQLGLSALALEFINMYPAGAGMLYVRGLAELDLVRTEEAQTSFAKAAPALYGEKTRLDEDNGMSHVLPVDVLGSLGKYYRHVVSLFVEHGADAAVVRFARLAIDALQEEGSFDGSASKDLWLKLFRSSASLGSFEEAYTALMAMPLDETRHACLAHLISVMSEAGHARQLTSFSFVGLEADLERNLAFRARNSDPLATPNYYNVLYSYHVSRGDYRSAGTVMFQQARRLGEISSRAGRYRELATLQCQSYLAAANALSLVSKDSAWIAVLPTDDGVVRNNKRRKISYVIPDEEFSDSASRAPEIVELDDVRREYMMALSRLQLSADFPELERTTFALDAEAVVALFSQLGMFDQAFTVARVLDVDTANLFELVTEKCVALSLHPNATGDAGWVAMNEEAMTWDGSLASKAWRLLERYLDRNDTDGTHEGRLVVLERTIALNGGARVPTFLTEFFLRNDPHVLIRTMIKYERIDDAFQYSLSVVMAPESAQLASSWLPYSLFDQLLALKSEDTAALSAEGLKQRQDELRRALDNRIHGLDRTVANAMKAR